MENINITNSQIKQLAADIFERLMLEIRAELEKSPKEEGDSTAA